MGECSRVLLLNVNSAISISTLLLLHVHTVHMPQIFMHCGMYGYS